MLTEVLGAAPSAPPQMLDLYWRLFICISGLLICATAAKVALTAFRRRDWQQVWGIVAFGLVIVSAATSSLFRFDQPLPKMFAVPYTAGLVAALVATWYRVKVSAPWLRWARRREGRAGE